MAATSFTSGDFSYTQESRDFIFSPTIADDEVYVSGYKGSSEYVDIPSSVYYEGKTYWVTGIDFRAFADSWKVRRVSLANVRTICAGAFESCSVLESIDLTNVTNIRPGAFHNCSSLKSVTLPDKLDSPAQWYGSPFSDCSSLTEMNVPESSTSFYTKDGVVILGRPYSSYGKVIYYPRDTQGKVSVSMPFDNAAFQYCSHITELYIDGGMYGPESADDNLRNPFMGCDALKKVKLTEEGSSSFGFTYIISSDIVFEVPAGSVKDYKYLFSSENVKEYGYIVECRNSVSCTIYNAETNEKLEFGKIIDTENLTVRIEPAKGYYISGLFLGDSDVTDRLTGDMTFAFLDTDDSRVLTVKIVSHPSLLVDYDDSYGNVYVNGIKTSGGDVIDAAGDFNVLILPSDSYNISSIRLGWQTLEKPQLYEPFVVKNNGQMQTLNVSFTAKPAPKPACLTVKGASSHSVKHYYNDGQEARIDILPEDGWALYSVVFNGDDITSQINGNTLVTPALHGDNTLEIVMKSTEMSATETVRISQEKVAIRTDGNLVEIRNLDEGEEISIYDTTGKCLYSGQEHTIELSRQNVYILKTSRETLKFAL